MALHIARPEVIDVPPGTVGQVHRALSGRMVAIDSGPHDVATRLHELDDSLRLHFDPNEDVWVVTQVRGQRESLVTSATVCDLRLVERVRQCMAPGYDLSAEIAKAEAKADRARQAQQDETFGDLADRMGHAFRKDLSRHEVPRTLKSRAFFPKDR